NPLEAVQALEKQTSEPPASRLIRVASLSSLDALPALVAAVEDRKGGKPERALATDVLRAWVGRQQGNDRRLYRHLRDQGKATEAEARSRVQLLCGCRTEDCLQPATYQRIIPLLKADRLLVRQVAAWQLEQLAPQESARVGFDPTQEGQRARAVAEWGKVLP